jgi:hypothetical protein
MNQGKALKRAQELIRTSNGSRAALEALTGLRLVYAYGNQWAGVGQGKARGHQLRQLRTIIDPDDPRIRVCMNQIRNRVRKVLSRLRPIELDFTVKNRSRAANDLVAAMVANRRLQLHTDEIDALGILRQKDLCRAVLGSAVIRRTIAANGREVVVRDEANNPKMGPNDKPLSIRSFRHGWAVCPPYEFIRDPSALKLTFDDDDALGHEKPRTADWVMRNFGVKINTDTTMGKLLGFQKFLFQATGQSLDDGWMQSELPAVLVSEWWFQDDTGKTGTQWPFYMLAYRDPGASGEDAVGLKPIHFGPNPFYELPLHHFWYEQELFCPWGKGIPDLLMQAQDIANVGWTSTMRQVVHHGNAKWIVEKDTLVDDPRVALNNQPNRPILIQSNANHIPRREPAAPLDQNAMMLLQESPQWLDRLLNMSAVQSGEAVKRGESAEAYRFRHESADSPINDTLKDDEIAVNALLTGTMFDLVKTDNIEALRELLSHEYTDDHILTLKSQDISQAVAGIAVKQDTLRPKTPQEQQEELAVGIDKKMIDPIAARRTLWIRTGKGMDAREQAALEQQQRELQSLLSGEFVEVYAGQDHAAHIYVLEMEQDSARWQTYGEEKRMHVDAHLQEHQMYMMPPDGGVLPEGAAEAAPTEAIPEAGPGMEEMSSLPVEAGLEGVA